MSYPEDPDPTITSILNFFFFAFALMILIGLLTAACLGGM